MLRSGVYIGNDPPPSRDISHCHMRGKVCKGVKCNTNMKKREIKEKMEVKG
jgi:hypothetical protein